MKDKLGHYDLIAELGRGGMGVVYKAHETSLNRHVAIKVLAQSLAHDASVVERFLREARSMAQLNDGHIIQIYFIGEDEGQPYFVMEFVEGESLSSMLKHAGKLSVEQAAKVIHQTAQGLAVAHDKGVIHRDIKPGNLMITTRGTVKIADFGIALATHDFSKKLTSTGEFVGTPGYLSPEVCLGKPVDQRSDIFSLGIVLFEMLTGRMPFTDESPLGLLLEVVRAEIPDVRQLNQQVDPEIAEILKRMIAKDPADRYQSCHDLAADLASHPLVSKGGTITGQAKIAPAAATVVGMKTPSSGQKPLPVLLPVEAAPRYTPAPIAAPAAAAPVRPSVLERQGQREPRGALLPWAIAATLLLGLGGGAYAFRDQIPFLRGSVVADQVASTGSTTAAPVAATAVAAAPTTPATLPVAANGADAAPATTTVAATTEPASSSATVETATAAQNEAEPNTAASVAAVADTETPETNTAVADVEADSVAVANDASGDTPAGPGPRAGRALASLHRLGAAREAERRTLLAKNTTPDPVTQPARPRVPQFAVISVGDSAVAGPAEQAIESAMSNDGYQMVDEEMLPGVAGLLGRNSPDLPQIMAAMNRGAHVDVLIVVNAKAIGSQPITFYGQSDTMYTVQLSVRPYSVGSRAPISAGWNEQVNFTALSAADKAREAVEPFIGEVLSRLAQYKSRRG